MASTSRLSAAEIFERVKVGGEQELARPLRNLALSALSAGLAMGVSGFGVAVLLHAFGPGRTGTSLAYLAYPLGFLIVILGRMQLFTENTLFPVALVLEERRHLGRTAQLWAVVLACNTVGTLLLALLVTQTPALSPPVLAQLVELGVGAGSRELATVFWTGVVGGWLIALVAWLVTASTDTAGQVLVILVLTYLVGVGEFAHVVAGGAEVLTAVLSGELSFASYTGWLAAAVLGNAAGGVVIVALLNYGQVHQEAEAD